MGYLFTTPTTVTSITIVTTITTITILTTNVLLKPFRFLWTILYLRERRRGRWRGRGRRRGRRRRRGGGESRFVHSIQRRSLQDKKGEDRLEEREEGKEAVTQHSMPILSYL